MDKEKGVIDIRLLDEVDSIRTFDPDSQRSVDTMEEIVVYPAAGLTRYFTGDTLAICNLAPTDQDANADLLISCDIAAAFAF